LEASIGRQGSKADRRYSVRIAKDRPGQAVAADSDMTTAGGIALSGEESNA